MKTSTVHRKEVNQSIFKTKYVNGETTFTEEGRCSYCGSLHPTVLAHAIKAGAQGSFADQKYGWPHKAYFQNLPRESWAKFYTVHLQDATEEEREIIEQHLGLSFTFGEDGSVSWKRKPL